MSTPHENFHLMCEYAGEVFIPNSATRIITSPYQYIGKSGVEIGTNGNLLKKTRTPFTLQVFENCATGCIVTKAILIDWICAVLQSQFSTLGAYYKS